MTASAVEAGSPLRAPAIPRSMHQYDRRLVGRLRGRAQAPTLSRVFEVLGACCAVTACRMGMLMGRRPAVGESVQAADDFPVQSGKAEGTLSVTAAFQPNCSPPMTVQFTNVTLVDQTSGARANIPGTF
jgi:hypothetical protein